MKPKGSLVSVVYPSAFYERGEINQHGYHFDLRIGELLVYLGEINTYDYMLCVARGRIGWVVKEAVRWV